jgi:hypothetical protein
MLHALFSLNSAIRNPHSAIGTANFLMDDTKAFMIMPTK